MHGVKCFEPFLGIALHKNDLLSLHKKVNSIVINIMKRWVFNYKLSCKTEFRNCFICMIIQNPLDKITDVDDYYGS